MIQIQSQLVIKIFLLLFTINLVSSECYDYYSPEKFYDAPEILVELFEKSTIDINSQEFDIIQNELYRYKDMEIATQINEDFGHWWGDWIGDGYEMELVPEQTLVKYKDHYYSMSVYIYGVIGDATKLKGTKIKYHFYNYTKQVNKYLQCKQKEDK